MKEGRCGNIGLFSGRAPFLPLFGFNNPDPRKDLKSRSPNLGPYLLKGTAVRELTGDFHLLSLMENHGALRPRGGDGADVFE